MFESAMFGWRSRPGARLMLAVGLSCALALAACSTIEVVSNQPLPERHDAPTRYGPGYRLVDFLPKERSEVMVFAAFSGGGKRSSAFGHGVLRGADRFIIHTGHGDETLLDDIVFIAAVSGGSFPAAHYGLYRRDSFRTFPEQFLYRDINAYIYGTYLLPWNWDWLLNPLYGSNDRMASVYDRLMFHGATYADLQRQGPPLISINATDIAGGVPFAFVQNSFDLICSDLGKFPIARAVAASNGFPIIFGPITLVSYRRRCGGARPPQSVPAGWINAPDPSRQHALAEQVDRYLDPERTQYVHLMDGGIADNLALRTMVNAALTVSERQQELRPFAAHVRRIVLISADGQAAADPTLGRRRVVTGLGQIFNAVSGTQIDAYNFESMLVAGEQLQSLVRAVAAMRCQIAPVLDSHRCDDVKGAFVHLSLGGIGDPALRQRLQSIPTGLSIPRADADALIAAGETEVLQSAALHALLDDVDAPQTVD